MAKYKIWDKTSNVITPIGEVLTPEQWIERYPVANVLDTVCSGGAINGAFFAVFDSMKEMFEKNVDFSKCQTKQDVLDAIEEFENLSKEVTVIPSPEERIAAALEAQVLMSMDDVM